MSQAVKVAQRPAQALRAVLPKVREAFSDVIVRFLANHWCPIRVIDETQEDNPRIWLRALNIGIIYRDGGYVVRQHPKKYTGSEKIIAYPVGGSKELLKWLSDFIGPYQI